MKILQFIEGQYNDAIKQLERAGRPSRWVTLGALTILRWWDG